MVVIESTGTYWKPFYYLLEDHLALTLVNAREAKTVPGRKTDVADAERLADLGAHGLVRASLVPPPPIRELRDLTRARATIARDRAREVQRLEKLLEDAQIKLSSVVTDLCGVASRRILTALMSGVTDPAALVLLRGGLKVSAADLTEALTGRFTEHHAFMTRLLLNRIDQHNAAIQHLEQRIEQKINSLDAPRDLLTSIPGVSRTVADIIIAETGADMTAFPSAAHLCSWAGVSPGQHESAGRRRTAPTRAGNRHLKAALGTAAMSTTRQRNTYLCAKYRRIAARRGKLRAVVAIERAILTAVWHMQHRHLLPRPRTGLLQQARPQQTRSPCRTRPPSPRLPGHRSPVAIAN
jgi:transposase